MPDLHSKRLRFINSDIAILNAILDSNESLSNLIHAEIPEKWSEFGKGPFEYVVQHLDSHPQDAPWWNWLAILKDQNLLVGNCGYKGPPKDGIVEIGYEVIPAYRGIGLATEIAALLVDHAFEFPEVDMIIAHTLAEENASCKVLTKCGFHFEKEIFDPEDGLIWKWCLRKEV